MTTVSGASGNTAAGSAGTKPLNPMQELGKDAFLQLLVTQLRYQDPLNPQDNSAFVAQMAQFTSLEQMQNLNDTVQKLLELQSSSHGHAPSYLGLTVTVTTGETNVTGTVSAVEYGSGKPMLVINGKRYGLESLVKVTAPESKAPPAQQPTVPAEENEVTETAPAPTEEEYEPDAEQTEPEADAGSETQ